MSRSRTAIGVDLQRALPHPQPRSGRRAPASGAIRALLGLTSMGALLACGPIEPDLGDDAQSSSGLAAAASRLPTKLAAVRAATAKYHDVEVALQDGFVSLQDCIEVPGLGAMGIHYVNFDRFVMPPDPHKPAILLYLPQGEDVSLVGVEYAQMILAGGVPYFGCGTENESCPPADPPPPPVLFGDVPFNGPMAGHADGMPWHYDQHVWIWRHNPSGMFAQFNPALSCGD